ncbi:MAG: protein kinase domain-containing protein, partial [Solirubrobacterales bacterium]
MDQITPGTTFGGYRIEAVAGRGGMGVVYRATDLALERPVALKVLSAELEADPDFRERFTRESRLAASIDHPNVIPIYEAGDLEGCLFIVMRWVDGRHLGQLEREEGLTAARALAVLTQVGSALDAAHERGLVHRDVKPGNILIARHRDAHAYLSDFGLSWREGSDPGLTRGGEWVGTPDYAAPEQIRGGKAEPATDIYALGCVLHEALTGLPPFRRGTRIATAIAHLEAEPEPLSARVEGLPEALDSVVAAALAKDPADRPATASELVSAATEALGGATPGPVRVLAPRRPAADDARTELVDATAATGAPDDDATRVMGSDTSATAILGDETVVTRVGGSAAGGDRGGSPAGVATPADRRPVGSGGGEPPRPVAGVDSPPGSASRPRGRGRLAVRAVALALVVGIIAAAVIAALIGEPFGAAGDGAGSEEPPGAPA